MKINKDELLLSQTAIFRLGVLRGVMMKMDESLLDYVCLNSMDISEQFSVSDDGVTLIDLFQEVLNKDNKVEYIEQYLLFNEWIIAPIHLDKVVQSLASFESFIEALNKCIDEHLTLINRIEENVMMNQQRIRDSAYSESTKDNLMVLYDYFKTHQKSDVSSCASFLNVSYNTSALLIQQLEELGLIQLINKQRRNKQYGIKMNFMV